MIHMKIGHPGLGNRAIAERVAEIHARNNPQQKRYCYHTMD